MTARVYTGTEWKIVDDGLKVNSESGFSTAYKLKVRLDQTWLPAAQTTNEESYTLTWTVEAPTAPPPPTQYYIVPNIVGDTQTIANEKIQDRHTVGNVTYTNTTVLANDGKVESQNPAAGLSVPEDTPISYVLYEYVTPQFTVPNLNGLLKSNAEQAVTELGGTIAALYTEETYDSNLLGRVKTDSQYPTAGLLVDEGTAVTFTYYTQAPTTTVPTINGLSNNNVYTTLNNANLNIGVTTQVQTENNTLSDNATIFNQSPAPGTVVPINTDVNYSYYIPNTHVNMINIVGLTTAQAEAALIAKELSLGTETGTTETTDVNLIGKIKTQGVAVGVSTPIYTSINYTIYVAVPKTFVPNLSGLSINDVPAVLLNAYLTAGSVTTVETTNASLENTVVPNSQSPAAGIEVNRNSTVSYQRYVPNTTTTVPPITNLTISQAQTACTNAEVTLASSASNIVEADVSVDTVYYQTPSAGSTVAIGTTIYYYKYTPYTTKVVPNVVGMTEANAKTAITNAGLNWSVTDRQLASGSTETAGVVYSQSPTSGGARVPAGSTVTITVNRAYVPTLHTGTGAMTFSPRWGAYYRGTNRSGTGTIGGRLGSSAPYLVGNYNSTSPTTSGNQYSAFQMNTSAAKTAIANSLAAGATITYDNVVFSFNSSGDQAPGGNNSRDWALGRGDTNGTTAPSVLLQSGTGTQTTPFYVAANSGPYTVTLNSTLFSWIGMDGSGDYPLTVHSTGMSTSVNNYGGISSASFTVYYSWSAYY